MLLRVPMMLPPVRITLLRLLIMLLRVLISTFHATTGTNNAVNATGDAANGRSGLAACTRSGTSRRGGRATLPQPTCRRTPTEQAEAAPLRRPQPPRVAFASQQLVSRCTDLLAPRCSRVRSGAERPWRTEPKTYVRLRCRYRADVQAAWVRASPAADLAG